MEIKYRLVDTANNKVLGLFDTPQRAQALAFNHLLENGLTMFDFKLVKVDFSVWQDINTFEDVVSA